jgi:hypothetical protein
VLVIIPWPMSMISGTVDPPTQHLLPRVVLRDPGHRSAWCALAFFVAAFGCFAGPAARAAVPDPAETRRAQLEAVARAALALPRSTEGYRSQTRAHDIVWGGFEGNVELVHASDLAQLIGATSPPRPELYLGANWPFEAAAHVDIHWTEWTDPLRAPVSVRTIELLERLEYVIVIFEDIYEDPYRFGLERPPGNESLAHIGRAAVFAMEGARLLAYVRLDTLASPRQGESSQFGPSLGLRTRLEEGIRAQVADIVGAYPGRSYGPLMELAPPPPTITNKSLELLVFVLGGFGALLLLFVVLGRRRHRIRHDFDGVAVQIITSDEGARFTLQFEAALTAALNWGARSQDGDALSGDEELDRSLGVRGPPLPALYAALAGVPIWRPIVDLGGRISGNQERLVVKIARVHGIEAHARRVAAHVRDLRRVGSGVASLVAISEDPTAPPSTRARIAIALTRWAPGSAETRAARERLGWTEPLEPHLIGCLTNEDVALVTDACDALASVGTAAYIFALESVVGSARPAANRALTAIVARGGDPRQGALALSSGSAGALSMQSED